MTISAALQELFPLLQVLKTNCVSEATSFLLQVTCFTWFVLSVCDDGESSYKVDTCVASVNKGECNKIFVFYLTTVFNHKKDCKILANNLTP
jgi:hypothetical protein